MSSECTRLEDVAEVIDSLHKTPSYCTHGFPMVRVTDVKYGNLALTGCHSVDEPTYLEFSRRFVPQVGDIVITRVGTYGLSSMVKDVGFCLGQNTAAIVPKSINSRYLYAALNSELVRSQIEAAVVGSTQKSLSLKCIKSLNIPRHRSDVEEAIAGVIGALDDRITLLRETNATLEAIAQALFKSWFVDFDPVRAKAEGRAPEGMDAPTAAMYPDSFEESELGLVPKGWAIGQLQDLLVLQRGFDLPAIERTEGEYPLIAASGPSGTHHIAIAKGPGVITGRSGVLGKVFLTLEDYWPLNTTLWVKEFKRATPCFAFQLLKLLDFGSFNAGSAVPTLNRNHIHSLKYVLPPAELVAAYEDAALLIHERVLENNRQAQTLTQLRDTLLPRLISGQLRLPEAEQAIEEAMA